MNLRIYPSRTSSEKRTERDSKRETERKTIKRQQQQQLSLRYIAGKPT